MTKWELFEVGMRRDEWKGLPEGLIIEWSDAFGLVLFVFNDRPTDKERQELSAKSRVEIAFKDINEIGFFAVKFGDLCWGDCCFSPNLSSVAPKFDNLEKRKICMLNIMLIDTSVGELKILRAISLDRKFTEFFHNWCIKSLEKNIGQRYYNKVIDEAYKKYPSPELLAEKADIRCTFYHREDGQKRGELEKE